MTIVMISRIRVIVKTPFRENLTVNSEKLSPSHKVYVKTVYYYNECYFHPSVDATLHAHTQ